MLKKAFRKLHRYLYLGTVVCCFLPLWPFIIWWSKDFEKHYSKLVRTRRLLARVTSFLAGFQYKIQYETSIDWNQPAIICPNHTSNLDISATMLACGSEFAFMGKDELLHNPVTGIFFRTIDIPINRNSKISSYRAFKRANEYLLHQKSVLIFPEGKIGDDYPPTLCDFKNGPFKLAIERGVPIIPMVIHDAWKLFWDDGVAKGSRPGVVHIEVLAPIETKNLRIADADTLKDQVFALMASKLNRM